MSRGSIQTGVILLVVGLLVGGSIGGILGASVVTPGPALQAPGTDGPTVQSTDGGTNPQTSAQEPTSYASLYEQTIDSVVKITVVDANGSSQGSGFIYDDEHIVTNEHVVEDAETVTVQFTNDGYRTGRVVGTDVYTDLAVIRVEDMPAAAEPLPVAERMPTPGQPVIALGTPFGLEGTVTHGIVSGVNRSMTVEGGFTIPDTVQTDAPINPGNSGGPLVSMDGTVVGVNRAKEGDNVGFAISAAVVDRIVPALIAEGEYAHTFVGIRTLAVTPQIAEVNDLPSAQGLMVVDLFEGSPGAAVFQPANATTVDGITYPVGGDVIVAIEGQEIASSQAFSRYLLLHTRPGEEVSITVIRDGQRQEVTVTLGDRPDA